MNQGKRYWMEQVSEFRRKALAGDMKAMSELGLILQQGIRDSHGRVIVRRDRKAGFRFLLCAAESGNTLAEFSLGLAHDLGWGTLQDWREALRWYSRAYRKGYDSAANNIATIYRDRGSLRLAFEWYRRAMDLGEGGACVDVGYYLHHGIRVKRDLARAQNLYRRAIRSKQICEYDREEAMYCLAVSHLDGGAWGAVRNARALLRRADLDGDYPEARALLDKLTRNCTDLTMCRCRRGLKRCTPGQAPCRLHPR